MASDEVKCFICGDMLQESVSARELVLISYWAGPQVADRGDVSALGRAVYPGGVRCVSSGSGGTGNREGKLLKHGCPFPSARTMPGMARGRKTPKRNPAWWRHRCSDEKGKPLKPMHSVCVPRTASEERPDEGYLAEDEREVYR
ncbi:hypothetical protein WA026_020807 [Henosepilachna vigintioctopunctata]|uniref:Uncharacterized protein n=1 Tax=Henosepilachna vigintioctopunctata TaxID=420089 RepID=A0AAW1TZC8_9CUCU